jgi:hypothetical protein
MNASYVSMKYFNVEFLNFKFVTILDNDKLWQASCLWKKTSE